MRNMNDYIPEEYSNVIKSLEPIVEKYELDSVMVSSIVRGSIEKEEQPIQPASKVWKSKDMTAIALAVLHINFLIVRWNQCL